ncbi:MAG: hypothetical protein M3O70_21625 [Actinomycetota bacterium]|nr:hypothetical protein [Actinomycetota bacterium]
MASKAKKPAAKQEAPPSPAGNGVVRIDPSKMRLRDIREMERLTGKPMSKLFEGGGMTSEGLAAFIATKRREEDSSFTLEDAYDVEMAHLEVETAPPTPAPSSATG